LVFLGFSLEIFFKDFLVFFLVSGWGILADRRHGYIWGLKGRECDGLGRRGVQWD
jgi:hypothetical protein